MAVNLQLFYHNRTRLERLNPLAMVDLADRGYVPQGRIVMSVPFLNGLFLATFWQSQPEPLVTTQKPEIAASQQP